MWPRPDLVVQSVPGTVSAPNISVTVQMVAGRDVAMAYSALDQILDGVQCCVVRFSVHETSHDGRGEPPAIVALGMGSHGLPRDASLAPHRQRRPHPQGNCTQRPTNLNFQSNTTLNHYKNGTKFRKPNTMNGYGY